MKGLILTFIKLGLAQQSRIKTFWMFTYKDSSNENLAKEAAIVPVKPHVVRFLFKVEKQLLNNDVFNQRCSINIVQTRMTDIEIICGGTEPCIGMLDLPKSNSLARRDHPPSFCLSYTSFWRSWQHRLYLVN